MGWGGGESGWRSGARFSFESLRRKREQMGEESFKDWNKKRMQKWREENPSESERAKEYRKALSVLRDRHRPEFDRILADIRAEGG